MFKSDGTWIGSRPRPTTLLELEDLPRVVDGAESQRIDEILKDCPPACARWMREYILAGNKATACRAINYSDRIVRWWQVSYPAFATLLKFYDDEVRTRWNEVAEARALEGFK